MDAVSAPGYNERKGDQVSEYDDLKAKVQALLAAGRIQAVPDRAQRIDFAYGNTKLENEDVTREMAEKAVDLCPSR